MLYEHERASAPDDRQSQLRRSRGLILVGILHSLVLILAHRLLQVADEVFERLVVPRRLHLCRVPLPHRAPAIDGVPSRGRVRVTREGGAFSGRAKEYKGAWGHKGGWGILREGERTQGSEGAQGTGGRVCLFTGSRSRARGQA